MIRVRCTMALLVAAGWLAPAPVRAQPADEHATAEALLAELQASPHATATTDSVRLAREALERATRLRVAGDEPHAKAADGVALEWAETARDIVRAADAESSAAELRRKAIEAQAQLDRSRALVEEAIASIGRLRAELEQMRGAPHADHAAVEVHDGDPLPKRKGAAKKAAPAPDKPTKTDAGRSP
jgi:hypothetical protein